MSGCTRCTHHYDNGTWGTNSPECLGMRQETQPSSISRHARQSWRARTGPAKHPATCAVPLYSACTHRNPPALGVFVLICTLGGRHYYSQSRCCCCRPRLRSSPSKPQRDRPAAMGGDLGCVARPRPASDAELILARVALSRSQADLHLWH